MPFLKDKRKLQSRCKKLEDRAKKNGLRHAVYTVHRDEYKGEWTDNAKNGKGTLLTHSYRLYEGDWSENFRHGFGVLAYRQENKVFALEYRGDWKRGMPNGFGSRHYRDGGYYLGYMKNGKRHGYGTMWYADGGYYDGDWYNDQRHGLGMWVRPDGNRYEGSWKSDMKHDKGRFFHLDSGQMQEGVWKSDICIYSFMMDIPFRQTAVQPTSHNISGAKLVDIEEMCKRQETHALADDHVQSCLSLSNTSNRSIDSIQV